MAELSIFYISGMLIPVIYILLYLLGGAFRSDYSHIRHSVSELLAPGSPNRTLLMIIQIIYAGLHLIFGLGILWFVMGSAAGQTLGKAGAWMIIALGVVTFGTVVFPQDAEGTPATFAGQTHKGLVFGGLIPLSVLSTLFIGLWCRLTGFLPGFDLYSFITVAAVVVMGAIGGATVHTRFAGLVERIAALITQQWLFVLGLFLFLNKA